MIHSKTNERRLINNGKNRRAHFDDGDAFAQIRLGMRYSLRARALHNAP